MRETPVASEKIAVDQASRRPRSRVSTGASIGTAPEGTALRRFATIGAPASAGIFMANLRQQKKRVRLAARQRVENLRYRSTVRTMMRRLWSAAGGGGFQRGSARHPAPPRR